MHTKENYTCYRKYSSLPTFQYYSKSSGHPELFLEHIWVWFEIVAAEFSAANGEYNCPYASTVEIDRDVVSFPICNISTLLKQFYWFETDERSNSS